MGLCSCLASSLAWGVQHWSLLVVEWSWVLALRWRSLEELLPNDSTWGWEVSGGPMFWTWLSHLRGSGLTPGQSTKTLSATRQFLCLDMEAKKLHNTIDMDNNATPKLIQGCIYIVCGSNQRYWFCRKISYRSNININSWFEVLRCFQKLAKFTISVCRWRCWQNNKSSHCNGVPFIENFTTLLC